MRAIEKINTEMQKRPDDLYMEIIGHYIIDRCGADEACEKKASDEVKTLSGAMTAVRNAAQKKAVSNCAVLTPDEVFSNIDKYFGFPADARAAGHGRCERRFRICSGRTDGTCGGITGSVGLPVGGQP